MCQYVSVCVCQCVMCVCHLVLDRCDDTLGSPVNGGRKIVGGEVSLRSSEGLNMRTTVIVRIAVSSQHSSILFISLCVCGACISITVYYTSCIAPYSSSVCVCVVHAYHSILHKLYRFISHITEETC